MVMNTAGSRSSSSLHAVDTNLLLLLLLAAWALLAPVSLLRGFGIQDPPFAVLGMARVFAAFCLVLGALLWSVRPWLTSTTAVPALRALACAYAGATILLMIQQWAVWYGRTGVALVFGSGLLAIEYWRLLRTLAGNAREHNAALAA
jgi:hypothetical protein